MYVKYNVEAELRKFLRNRPMKTRPEFLLAAIAAEYLALKKGLELPANKAVYTINEVAEMMGFSRQTVTRLFEDEPGVLTLSRPTKMNKRRYESRRIPHGVFERVARRLGYGS